LHEQVTLASSSAEEYTREKPFKKAGSVLSYGPYSNIAPWSMKQFRAHFQNNKPFVVVPKLEREIQISQWGNIYVEEAYTLVSWPT
jgi:oligosaccharyltransferase complex subunit alpha (ribophorin I)